MKMIYAALLYTQDDGSFTIKVPDIPGCVTSGKNLQEAYENICDAAAACLCTLEDFNEALPEPSSPGSLNCEGATTALIEIDTLKYRRETDTKCVRKNVSLPSWMSYMADSRGINCSQVLQDALKKQLKLA